MMTRLATVLAVAIGLLTVAEAPARADCDWVTRTVVIGNDLVTITKWECDGSTSPIGDQGGNSTPDPPPAGSALCSVAAEWLGVDVNEMCGADSPDAEEVITPDLVGRALRRVTLPPSRLVVQPPGGKTLVNFATNFYTHDRTLHRTVRLLGQRVDLRIEAHSYTWHFGDGESTTTTEAGAPYPKLEVTHDYLQTGSYRPSVDTTWIADFRVGGGPWRAVPGSVTIEGDPADLEAIEARPTLVGYGR